MHTQSTCIKPPHRAHALATVITRTTHAHAHTQIIPGARKMGYKVQAHAFEGYWEDIGTIEAFYNANLALADPSKHDFR